MLNVALSTSLQAEIGVINDMVMLREDLLVMNGDSCY